MTMSIRCGSCGSSDLSPELRVQAHNGVYVYLPSNDDGWLSQGRKIVACSRVCFNCGFIGLYARKEDREELRSYRERVRHD